MKNVLIYFVILLPTFGVAQSTIQNGLQACYALDCAVQGQVINGANTGSVLNGLVNGNVVCTTGHLGAANSAMQFGGTSSDYIALPNNPLIKPTTSLTVSGWYFVTSLAHQDLVFTKNTCSFNFNGYNLMSDNGTFQIVKKPGTPGSCNSGALLVSSVFPINTWHHVVFYMDDVQSTIIVDNTTPLSLVHNIAFDYDGLTDVILGGTNESAANNPYSGIMDNVRFWDRELTAAEITSLYNSDSLCVELGSAPTASFTASANQLCFGQTVTFTNQSTNNSSSFNWQVPGASPATSTLSAPVFSFPTPGVYTVSLIANNNFGSSAPYTQIIQVSECTSIAAYSGLNVFSIYPNPSTGKIYLNHASNKHVEVYDISGKLVHYNLLKIEDELLEMDLLDNANGVYFIKIEENENNVSYYSKIILIR